MSRLAMSRNSLPDTRPLPTNCAPSRPRWRARVRHGAVLGSGLTIAALSRASGSIGIVDSVTRWIMQSSKIDIPPLLPRASRRQSIAILGAMRAIAETSGVASREDRLAVESAERYIFGHEA